MTIIRDGKEPQIKEFHCGHCGCIFQATEDEYDLSFADCYEVRCWCKCPKCSSVVGVSEAIPIHTKRLKRAQKVFVVMWDGGDKKETDAVFSSQDLAEAYIKKQQKKFENIKWYFREFEINERTFVLKFDSDGAESENEPLL